MPRDTIAVDEHGKPLPSYTSEQATQRVDEMLAKGNLLAVIVEVDDQIAVQVLGPPSEKIARSLEQAATAYRRVLRGH